MLREAVSLSISPHPLPSGLRLKAANQDTGHIRLGMGILSWVPYIGSYL